MVRVGLKLSPKHARAVIPRWVFRHGLELHTLRGLFDTDGCIVFDKQNRNIHYYPRLELKISPGYLSNQIAGILAHHSFRYSTSNRTGSNTLRFQINGKFLLEKWAVKVGFNNPKHRVKYAFWNQNGYFQRNVVTSDSLRPSEVQRSA